MRYTEGSLIKAMREAWRFAEDPRLKGIGTPATRDAIIDGLKKQHFLEVKNGKLKASELAMAVYATLRAEAQEILDPRPRRKWNWRSMRSCPPRAKPIRSSQPWLIERWPSTRKGPGLAVRLDRSAQVGCADREANGFR